MALKPIDELLLSLSPPPPLSFSLCAVTMMWIRLAALWCLFYSLNVRDQKASVPQQHLH